jgi:ketosteroid isomerase-like protein
MRRLPFRPLLLVLTAASLAACSRSGGSTAGAPSSDNAADVAAVKATEANWDAAFKANNLEAVLQHYAHDAVLMNPGEPVVTGADPIRDVITAQMQDPKFSLTFSPVTVVVAQAGDYAYTTGKFTQTHSNPKTHAEEKVTGGYVAVYRKAANGAWKAVADIATPGPAKP